MANPKIKFDLFDTYIANIENSIGTQMFRELYLYINGEKKEASQNGRWTCGVFISSILTMFNLINERHATMDGLFKDMQKTGWYKIKKPKIGAVLWWEVTKESEGHEHAGFYVGNNEAISNSWLKKTPVKHKWLSGTTPQESKRLIKSIWWNDKLN